MFRRPLGVAWSGDPTRQPHQGTAVVDHSGPLGSGLHRAWAYLIGDEARGREYVKNELVSVAAPSGQKLYVRPGQYDPAAVRYFGVDVTNETSVEMSIQHHLAPATTTPLSWVMFSVPYSSNAPFHQFSGQFGTRLTRCITESATVWGRLADSSGTEAVNMNLGAEAFELTQVGLTWHPDGTTTGYRNGQPVASATLAEHWTSSNANGVTILSQYGATRNIAFYLLMWQRTLTREEVRQLWEEPWGWLAPAPTVRPYWSLPTSGVTDITVTESMRVKLSSVAG